MKAASLEVSEAKDVTESEQLPFPERVAANQRYLAAHLRKVYDFIVCGSGSSGSVVARRLAENPGCSVLLLEAGGSDEVPSVTSAGEWPSNLGSERDWAFQAQPNPHLNGRALPLNMGKVLGGGSSINVMIWSRGHKHDWDFFAQPGLVRPLSRVYLQLTGPDPTQDLEIHANTLEHPDDMKAILGCVE